MSQTISLSTIDRFRDNVAKHRKIMEALQLREEPRLAMSPGTPPMLQWEDEEDDDEDDYWGDAEDNCQ